MTRVTARPPGRPLSTSGRPMCSSGDGVSPPNNSSGSRLRHPDHRLESASRLVIWGAGCARTMAWFVATVYSQGHSRAPARSIDTSYGPEESRLERIFGHIGIASTAGDN